MSAQFAVLVDDNGALVGSVFGEDRVLIELDGILAKADIDPEFGEYVPVPLASVDVFHLNLLCNSPKVRSTAVETELLVANGSQWGVTGAIASPIPPGSFVSQRNAAGVCQSVTAPQGVLLLDFDPIATQPGFTPPLAIELRQAGDLNGDGLADVVDVSIFRRQLAGLPINL